MSRQSPFLRWSLAGAVTAVVLVHMAVTVLVNTPLNPLRLKHARALAAYTQPLFEQRWSLFAPMPANTNRSLLVQCRGIDRASMLPWTSPWLDVTFAGQVGATHHWYTPTTRVLRTVLAGPQVLAPDADSVRIRTAICTEMPESAPCKQPETSDYAFHVHDVLVDRSASAFARKLVPAGIEIRELRTRIASQNVLPFSKRMARENPEPVLYAESPWRPFQRVSLP